MDITVYALSIPFKFKFSHARKTRKKSSSVLVEIKRGPYVGFGEGCPRKYVTGETIDGAIKWIKRIANTIKDIEDISTLKHWVLANELRIDKNPSAWCAVETAIIDLIGKESGKTFNEILNIKKCISNQKVTAVISEGNLEFVNSMLDRYLDFGFTDFKIKFSGDLGKDSVKVDLLKNKIDKNYSVRVDFNNVFSSKNINEFVQYLGNLNYKFFAIEEPFESRAFSSMLKVIEILKTPIILDESFTKIQDIDWIEKGDGFIPNIRVSKIGGILRTLDLIELVKRNIGKFILGSLVGETSILSRLWLIVAGYSGEYVYAREGAYSTHLLECDITESPIIIGRNGEIDIPETVMDSPGLGIEISPNILQYAEKY